MQNINFCIKTRPIEYLCLKSIFFNKNTQLCKHKSASNEKCKIMRLSKNALVVLVSKSDLDSTLCWLALCHAFFIVSLYKIACNFFLAETIVQEFCISNFTASFYFLARLFHNQPSAENSLVNYYFIMFFNLFAATFSSVMVLEF